MGLQVQELPLSLSLRNALSRKIAGVMFKQNSTTSTSKTLKMRSFTGKVEMRFTPVNCPSFKARAGDTEGDACGASFAGSRCQTAWQLWSGPPEGDPQCVEERQDANGNCVESPYLPVSRDRSWRGLSGTEFIEITLIFNPRQSCRLTAATHHPELVIRSQKESSEQNLQSLLDEESSAQAE